MFKKNLIIASIIISSNNLINGCGKCGVTSEALAKKLCAYCLNDKNLNISNNALSVEDASLFLETFKKFVKLTEHCETKDDGDTYEFNIEDPKNQQVIKALFQKNDEEKIFGNAFMKKMLGVINSFIKYIEKKKEIV